LDSVDGIGRDVHLHAGVSLDKPSEDLVRHRPLQAAEYDPQPLLDGPVDVAFAPDQVEARLGGVVREVHAIPLDGLDRVQGGPHLVATLVLLRAQAALFPLGLVGVVVDEGVPKIECHRSHRHETAPSQ
jgi:hypothetical protein